MAQWLSEMRPGAPSRWPPPRRPALLPLPLLLLLLLPLWVGPAPSLAHEVAPCSFNTMCSCKFGSHTDVPTVRFSAPPSLHGLRDITCVGVPFSTMPELPAGSTISHVDVVGSGLGVLEADALGGARVESLRLMSNSLLAVAPRAFSSSEEALKSVDLSYNELDEVPFEALQSLENLDWLNLHSNQIASLEGDWRKTCGSLTNMFVGENQLTELPAPPQQSQDGTSPPGGPRRSSLRDCSKLTWLNVDSNRLRALEGGALPPSLHTLSASHNLLTAFPGAALDALPGLSWLYLRDNYITQLPASGLRPRRHRLEQLDLGDNRIASLPSNLFNGSLQVRDLNLDRNLLRGLPAQAFRGTSAGRLFLSRNRLHSRHIDQRAFSGLAHSLEALDLEHNLLREVPRAIAHLKKLKFLYLPSNNISDVHPRTLPASLRVLSLEGNRLSRIPSVALRNCTRLLHLNVGYNRIDEVRAEDFEDWATSLETLLLRNNRIAALSEHAFAHAPRLRELSLSFNKLGHLHPEALANLADSLESLEVSFGLDREDFPAEFLRPLRALAWLALDNNELRTVGQTDLHPLSQLQYLNLESNKLTRLPPGFFHPEMHPHLRDVRLSYNLLEALEEDTLWGLPELRTAVLTGNRLRALAGGAVRDLPALLTLMLADNRLAALAPAALSHLPALSRLDLQHNRLKELSLSAFHNVTAPATHMALNLSYNALAALHAADGDLEMYVRVLDLSHNLLSEIPVNFLRRLSGSLRRLHLGYNRLSRLEARALGPLPHLEELSLPHNGIVSLRTQAFAGAGGSLQLLDLSHNHVETLQLRQFHGLPHLRVLDLSHNHIRSVPRDAFRDTQLERLDLSHNQLVVMPGSSLAEVGATLRRLQLSHNQLEHLDSSMFLETPHLLQLHIAHNKLTILPDNVFSSVDGLSDLDLSGNPLRANFKELFHYVQRLHTLSLANTGLRLFPPLPLPHLVRLNLSDNLIGDGDGNAHLDSTSSRDLSRLRYLTLSGNRLGNVPAHIWPMTPLLRELDLTRNPIKVLTRDSFSGLSRLTFLNLEDLPDVERFELDCFAGLPQLATLRIQTWPRADKYRLRLGGALSAVWPLRELSVRVQEAALADQLQGAFSHAKLRRLELSGCALRAVAPDALDGLADSSHELQLHLRHTSLDELPAGLVAGLAAHVSHLALDLRDNRFASISPSDLYPNGSLWESVGTKPFPGGLLLSGNPWTCDCGLVWLGHWLRRWLRETLQIHTVVVEGAQQLSAAAREATCWDAAASRQVALLQLRAPDLACHPSALSHGGAAPRSRASLLLALAPLVLTARGALAA
ncbi:chaoptin-like [Schistocerca gregaria]|uniref:chaoptin-like n=1 Tax=Schistocerca gregaria TaxID=7010 RepID=UPI00211EFD5C|nr:chaoptin-like [Schistocerca gregaria]XP_049854701.1 chaoptin-like [Schistocerca gregaria]